MAASDFDAQRQALWQAWLSLQSSAEAAIHKGAAHYFTCIRQSTCDKLTLDALTSARLGQSDEGVYDHLVYLMETYREVIRLFDGQVKGTSHDLVAGLCEILTSRLNQFGDVATGQGNPVVKEKHAILEKAIIRTTQQIEVLEKSYLDTVLLTGLRKELLTGNAETAWQSLRESIIEATLPTLHTHYQENLHRCLSGIDDLHTRKTASYYTDLLEREWEVLGLIIRVQVQALETAFEREAGLVNTEAEARRPSSHGSEEEQPHTGQEGTETEGCPSANLNHTEADTLPILNENYTGEEAQPHTSQDSATAAGHSIPELADSTEYTLHNILSKLREVYQQTGPIISNLRKTLQSAPGIPCAISGLSCEMFTQALIAFPPPTATIDAQPFESALLPEADALFEELRVSHFEMIHNLQLSINDETSLAEAIVAAFEKAGHDLAAPADTLCASGLHVFSNSIEAPQPEDEILSGITETIEIKVESLKESLAAFRENSGKLLGALSTEAPALTEADLVAGANTLQSAWCANPPTPETIADFITQCISLGAFAAYNEQFTKLIANYTAKADKATVRFKKEALLYEISTYEEILYYSVSRLRESPLPQVEAAVRILDETFNSLEALLITKGITVIRPAPHEPFNGREHEVLAVEVQEGFTKGEIIKVMTSGYKHQESVILRANVIAAR